MHLDTERRLFAVLQAREFVRRTRMWGPEVWPHRGPASLVPLLIVSARLLLRYKHTRNLLQILIQHRVSLSSTSLQANAETVPKLLLRASNAAHPT
jgi:hypothetical protein